MTVIHARHARAQGAYVGSFEASKRVAAHGATYVAYIGGGERGYRIWFTISRDELREDADTSEIAEMLLRTREGIRRVDAALRRL